MSRARLDSILGTLGLVGTLVFTGCHRAPAAEGEAELAVPVHCRPADRASIDDTVSLRGRIEPPPGGDLPVASQVSGRIVSVAVQEGQHVSAGDVVATVDDLASRDALRQADAQVAQAKAQQTNALATLERTKGLVAKGIAPRQELDDATARADAAKGATDAAIAAADLARRTLGRVQVRSSFAGVVTKLWRGPGALVDGSAATPIAQLAASDKLEFVADATERELQRVASGQLAVGALDGGARPFHATVRVRSSSIESATGLGAVRLTLTDDPGAVVGSYGRVTLTVAHRDGVRVVPTTAIRGAVADGVELVVCKDGEAEVRTVTIGFRDDQRTEVLTNLADDERVAVDHVLGLETGTKLQELAPEAAPTPDAKSDAN